MDNRSDIRDFLASRRGRITPERAGLLPGGGRRRVPGLRREEVAVLAGVSTDWYIRLEKGHIAGVSEDVLNAVARALQLDEAERRYLFDLARAAKPARAPQRRSRVRVQPRVQWLLDSMSTSAAFVANGRMDILAANTLGRALYAPVFDHPQANIARFQFLDPRARDFHPDWDGAASTTVALLRTEAGRDPHDKDLRELVGELSTVSEEFRTRWAAHDVRIHRTGIKQFHHTAVGTLDLVYHSVTLPTEDRGELHLTAYTAEPGTSSEDSFKLLASWAATTTTATTPWRIGPDRCPASRRGCSPAVPSVPPAHMGETARVPIVLDDRLPPRRRHLRAAATAARTLELDSPSVRCPTRRLTDRRREPVLDQPGRAVVHARARPVGGGKIGRLWSERHRATHVRPPSSGRSTGPRGVAHPVVARRAAGRRGSAPARSGGGRLSAAAPARSSDDG